MEILHSADSNNITLNGKPQRIERVLQLTPDWKANFLNKLSEEELYKICEYYEISTNVLDYKRTYPEFRKQLIEIMSERIEFTALMLLDADAPTELNTIEDIRAVNKYRRAVITSPYVPALGIYIDDNTYRNNDSVHDIATRAIEEPGVYPLETLIHSGLELQILHNLIVEGIYERIEDPVMREKVIHALYLLIQIAAYRSKSKTLLLPIGVGDLIHTLNTELKKQNGEYYFIPSYEIHNPIYIPLDLITEIVKSYTIFLIALAHNLANKGEFHYDLISFDGHAMIERLLPIKGHQGQFRELFELTVKLSKDKYSSDEIRVLREQFENELKKLTEYYLNMNDLTIDSTESLGRKSTGFINAQRSADMRERQGAKTGKKLVTQRWSSLKKSQPSKGEEEL